MAEQLVFK